jgi:hypothetical protein
MVLVQTPLHACSPPGQAQVPLVHEAPNAHAWPHAPQFCGSVWVLMHTPLQLWAPPGHVQTPLWHVWLPGQTWPHDPQLPGSLVVSTQTPLQLVLLQTQLPVTQA